MIHVLHVQFQSHANPEE
jgi:hypothetical protein